MQRDCRSDRARRLLCSWVYLSGQPTSAAAALANLEVIEKDNLIAYIHDDAGPYFQEKLKSFATYRAVGQVRGYGLIGAIELVPREGKAALTPTSMLGNKAVELIRKECVIVRGIRDLIALSPPFIISRAEIDQLFDAARKGLDGSGIDRGFYDSNAIFVLQPNGALLEQPA